MAFGGYTVWALMQQLLLQGYFLARLLRIFPNANMAALLTAIVFALAHLPNPILTPLTLDLGTDRLPRLRPLAQRLSAGHRPCHLRHLRRDHHSRVAPAQHARRSRLHQLPPSAAFTSATATTSYPPTRG